jgi:hypothetical protein
MKLLNSFLVLALLCLVGCVPQSKPLNDDMLERFNLAVADSVQKSHAETMTELQGYRSTLDRIEQAVTELQAKAKEKKSTLESVKTEVAAVTAVEKGVTRMPGSSWNVEGNWNYTLVELANHLRSVHGLNVDGKTMQELQTMHDNLHNGYSAYGAPARSSSVVAPAQYYVPRQPTTIFRRARSYSTCPPGQVCPQ